MITVDVFEDYDFFKQLEVYNKDIREVCNNHSFAKEGEDYDLDNDKSSCWFDPDFIRELHVSEFYPYKVALPHHVKFNLIFHVYNYISLYVISLLYKERKGILIEDHAGGMGRLLFYLSKRGFNNFNNIDNFTQLSKTLFIDLMQKGCIECTLNNFDLNPIVINLSAFPIFLRKSIPDTVELICCYYHSGIIKKEGCIFYIKVEDGWISLFRYRLLCIDRDNLIYIFCKKGKYKEFYEKIESMEYIGMNKNKILQYEPLIEKLERVKVIEYMDSGGWLTEFKETEQFENEIKSFLGVSYCSVVNNGTISLSIALMALGIEPGDRVAVPNLTMIATINAVKLIGAEPVILDIEEDTLCMDPLALRNYKQLNLKAIIYVSLNGRWNLNGELVKMFDILRDNGIHIIEDAAQSFGSNNYRNRIGGDADISSFSFSMPKIITTGQGGCLVTNDDQLAIKIKKLKDFGRESGGMDVHSDFGINSKFTDIQAVIGSAQLKNIEYRVKRKKEMYTLYHTQLKDYVYFIPTDVANVTPWFIDIYLKDINQRNDVFLKLKEQGIGTRAVYPPINSQGCYKEYLDLYLPISTSFSDRGLWLPSSFTLENDDIVKVCNAIKSILGV